jgi:transposase
MANRSRRAVETPTGSTTEPEFELTDEQWNLIADLFVEPPVGPKGGRPRVASRPCAEGILWILRTGAPWKHLPKHFPSPATCWRRLKAWTEAGIWEKAWARLLRQLDRQGRVAHEESFADGTFSSAKKGAKRSARPNGARGRRSWSSRTAVVFRSRWILPALALTK